MNAEEYMRLPYHISMVRDESGSDAPAWVVWVDELPGCVSQGSTPAEAMEMIDDAMRTWLEVALRHGDTIPEPRGDASHSGKLMVRLPSSLHAVLTAGARREGVSLNQYIATLLAGAVGWSPRAISPGERRRTGAKVSA